MISPTVSAKYYYKGVRDGKAINGFVIARNRQTALASMSRIIGVEWQLLDEFKAWTEDDDENSPFAHKQPNKHKPRVRLPAPAGPDPANMPPAPSSLTVVKSPDGGMQVTRTLPPPPPARNVDSIKVASAFKIREA